MKKTFHHLVLLVLLICVLLGGVAVGVARLEGDSYRPQLVAMLAQKTGRRVEVNGNIRFSLGLRGLRVTVAGVALGNPDWASRSFIASIRSVNIGVEILPLLAHRLVITDVAIDGADILLESNAVGEGNWVLTPAALGESSPKDATHPTSAPSTSGLSVQKIEITDSQLALRDAAGKVQRYAIDSLRGTLGIAGIALDIRASVNGAPLGAQVKTNLRDLAKDEAFSFSLEGSYNAIHFSAEGKADTAAGLAEIAHYEISAGKTMAQGVLSLAWKNPRPVLRGTLESAHVDFADLSPQPKDSGGGEAGDGTSAPSSDNRLFSDQPLPFAALKAVDADLDVAVKELVVGRDVLHQISTKASLTQARLSLSPLRLFVGETPVAIQVAVDASASPAQVTLRLVTDHVDLGVLQKLSGMVPFMKGNASANIQLSGAGDSPHVLASSLGGVITILAEHGEILTGSAAALSSALTSVLAPGGGDAAMNCLAVRLIAKQGVLTDNGILIDSAPSTLLGKGGINLAKETIAWTLKARTKMVGIGSLLPALEIGGSLMHPSYKIDEAGVITNVVGALTGNGVDTGVPEMQTAPAGQNACLYTLDHPKAPATPTLLSADTLKNPGKNIQNIGKALIKGFFGQ